MTRIPDRRVGIAHHVGRCRADGSQARWTVPTLRRGSVLILAMVALIVLTSLALMLGRTTRVQANASANSVAQIQAQAVAAGAVEYVRALLANINESNVSGISPGQIPDPDEYDSQAVPVGNGHFWLLEHDPDQPQQQTFGLIDEAGKLDLNTATQQMLSELPNMTDDVAAAIVDWRDSNDEPSSGDGGGGVGAETSYYLMLPSPYRAKNGPFETVDELQLVRGVTPELLVGQDINHNGVIEADEQQMMQSLQLAYGLAAYTTVYSSQPNTAANGQRRTNVNGNIDALRRALQGSLSGGRLNSVLDKARTGRPFSNLIDFYYRAALTKDEFAQVADKLTTSNSSTLTGLIDLNGAPAAVLATLPDMTPADGQAIVAHRQTGARFNTLADLIDVVDQAKATAIGGLVTVRSYRWAADILAVDGSGRSFKREWVVFDTQVDPPRVIYRRDLTSLGWPLDNVTLADVRNGRTGM